MIYICIYTHTHTHTGVQNIYTILPLQGFVLEKRVGSELESDLDGFLVLGH